jgi:chitinase
MAQALNRPFIAYQASWGEVATTEPGQTALARLPGFIDVVVLGFAKPDAVYAGDLQLAGTGLQYPFSGTVLRDAVSMLKQRNPGTRVLLSVGGSAYVNWDRLDETALAALIRDLGLDGVDVDFEPRQPGCRNEAGTIRCASDALWIDYITRFRRALPRPMLIGAAGWSVGAFGEGAYRNARPPSDWTGSMLGLLRSPAAAELDLLSIMSYDAGSAFQPGQAFDAYRAVWNGPLALGIQVLPSELPGSPRHTLKTVARLLDELPKDPRAGAMLYALQLTPPGANGPDNPSAGQLAQLICRALGKAGCDAPVP